MKRTNLFFGLAFALFCSLPMYAQTVSEDVDINKALEFTKQQGVKVEVIKRGN